MITLREPSKNSTGPDGAKIYAPAPISDRIVHAEGYHMALTGGRVVGLNYPDDDQIRFVLTAEGVDDEGNPADVTLTIDPNGGAFMAEQINAALAQYIQWSEDHSGEEG